MKKITYVILGVVVCILLAIIYFIFFHKNTLITPQWSIGDSITQGREGLDTDITKQGQNYTEGLTYQYWFDEYTNTNSSLYNRGINGQRCPQMEARFDNDIGNNGSVIIMCGINDIGADGRIWQQVVPYIRSMVNKAKAKGDYVILLGILPSIGYGECIDINGVNNWIDETYKEDKQVLIIHANKLFKNKDDCSANSLLYESDGIHLNMAGNKKLGTLIADTLL